MLGEIILEILKDLKWLTTNVVFNDYYSANKNLRRYLHRGRSSLLKNETESEWQKKERQKFYNLLYYLKKQGFIEKRNSGNKKGFWKSTSRGLQYLKKIKQKQALLSLKPENLKKDYLKVIIFDIPENKRKGRDRLRSALTNFNFSMLQKSVWIGETQLPEDFFHSLKELNLLPYIHIFAIDKEKSGTLHLKR